VNKHTSYGELQQADSVIIFSPYHTIYTKCQKTGVNYPVLGNV